MAAAAPGAASPSPFSVAAPPREVPGAASSPRPGPEWSHRDLWFGIAAATLTTVAVFNDGWLTDETTESTSPGEHRLSRALEPAGNLAVVAPAILLAYGAGRLSGRPGLAGTAQRIGASVATAGLLTFTLKQVAGRERPRESAGDSHAFQPFSGHGSFPSGHTTIAFAAATALVRETDSRWVPWAAYPAAAMVGWSRVHDNEHWTSDVVMGAALGTLTANKVESLLLRRAGRPVSIELQPERHGFRAGVGVRF